MIDLIWNRPQLKCPFMVCRRTSSFLQLEITLNIFKLNLRDEIAGTSHADTDQDDVSLAGVLQDAVGRTV